MNTHPTLVPAAGDVTFRQEAETSYPSRLSLTSPIASSDVPVDQHHQLVRATILAGHQKLVGCFVTILGWVLGVWLSAVPTYAAIQITELYPAPATGESEWVELYNDSLTESADLTGWWLQDQVSSPSLLTTLSDLVLPPRGFVQISWSSSKLNNSGDTITLYDQTNQVVDTTSFTGASSGMSWAKVGNETTGFSWIQQSPTPALINPEPSPVPTSSPSPSPLPSSSPSPSPSSTPTSSPTPSPSPNPVPSPTPTPSPTVPIAQSDQLRLTQLMACPLDNQTEWVKIHNASNQTLSYNGWYLTDTAGNRRTLNGTISAHTFATFHFTSSFINNTGETLYFSTPTNQLIQTIELPACDEKNIPFIDDEGMWIAENMLNADDSVQEGISNTTVLGSTTAGNKDWTISSAATPFTTATRTNSRVYLEGSSLDSEDAQAIAGASADLQALFNQQSLHFPTSATNLIKPPLTLFEPAPISSSEGIVPLITGGLIMSLTSITKLLSKYHHFKL
jgi:hypothetical protein